MQKDSILTLFFICLATSLFTIDMGIITISFNNIENYFSTTSSVTSWVLTVFSISSAIGIVSLGFLSKIFGRNNIYLINVLGFSLFSGFCGLADNIQQLLLFRFFQGFFGSGLVALSQALVLDIFSLKNRSKALSAWTFGLLSGPVLGPILGGYLIEYLSWRWIFFINVPLGIIAFLGLFLNLEREKIKKNIEVNFSGFLLLSAAIASLQVFLDRGELEDWFDSFLICCLAFIFLICLFLYILNNCYSNNPLFSKKLFADRNFLGGLVFAFLFGLILIPHFILFPMYLSQVQSFPIYSIGLIVSISGIGGMLSTFFTSKIISILGNIKTMLLGLFLFVICNINSSFWNIDSSTKHIILNSLFRGISISIYYVALANITYITLPSTLRTQGASLFQFLRTTGTGIAVAIIIISFNKFYNIHFDELRSSLNMLDPNNSFLFDFDTTPEQKKVILSNILSNQSKMNSLINEFLILSLCPFLFLPFFLLFSKKKN